MGFYRVLWDEKRAIFMYIGFCGDYKGLCREYTIEGYVTIL